VNARAVLDAVGALALGLSLWGAYALAIHRRRDRDTATPSRIARWSFALGAVVVVVALWPPFDDLAASRFSWHMAQHLLLLTVAAPLLAAGRPELVLGRPAAPAATVARRLVAAGLVLSTIAVWAWHVPLLFEAALRSDPVHIVEHLTLLGAGLVFWWPVLAPTIRLSAGFGAVLAALVAGGLQATALGALIVFSASPWYPDYVAEARALGYDALTDQQAAGLLMWIPPSVLQLVVAAALFLVWIGREESDLSPPRVVTQGVGYPSETGRRSR